MCPGGILPGLGIEQGLGEYAGKYCTCYDMVRWKSAGCIIIFAT